MTTELEKARDLLLTEGYTCVLLREDTLYTSFDRGITPLLNLLDAGVNLSGFCAADKVIGKATAFLYCLLGVREVYTPIISTAALQVLEEHSIRIVWDEQASFIWNRRRTGPCPMETAVQQISDPASALTAIRKTLQNMR